MKTIKAADLFCGAGGTSTGLIEACAEREITLDLTAINHWPIAIATHQSNHANVRHLCQSVERLNPRDVFPDNDLDLLWASPECMHHSVARGGKPINDQSRATAWCVVRWAEALAPKVILVENVQEFTTWGPIGSNGKPLKSRRGEVFHAWIKCLEALGYRVAWRVLRAADYGDPTTRERLFVYAVKGRRKIEWPEPTHAAQENTDMLEHRVPWVAAREIIDWSLPGQSIFTRKRPLCDKTLNRIAIGLQKFGLAPFIVPQHRGGQPVKDVNQPVPSLTTTSRGIGLAQPFFVHLRGTSKVASLDKPAPTVTAGGGHLGLVQPFLVNCNHGNGNEKNADNHRARALKRPMPTVTGSREWALCEPFILAIEKGSGNQVRPADEPVSTITTKQRHAIVQPFILPNEGFYGGNAPRSIDKPLPTVTAERGAGAIVQPYLVKFNGTGAAHSVNEPFDTLTTKDRFGLVQPVVEIDGQAYLLDVHFRMLQPHELAQAQGFPKDYKFTGNRSQMVKQIGNAVPKNLAKALVKSALACL